MSTKHTPGPWKTINGHYIVDVYANGQSVIGEGMRIEDARLIAAAPELLAALVMLLERLPDKEGRFMPSHMKEPLRLAREAIAKAEGIAP